MNTVKGFLGNNNIISTDSNRVSQTLDILEPDNDSDIFDIDNLISSNIYCTLNDKTYNNENIGTLLSKVEINVSNKSTRKLQDELVQTDSDNKNNSLKYDSDSEKSLIKNIKPTTQLNNDEKDIFKKQSSVTTLPKQISRSTASYDHSDYTEFKIQKLEKLAEYLEKKLNSVEKDFRKEIEEIKDKFRDEILIDIKEYIDESDRSIANDKEVVRMVDRHLNKKFRNVLHKNNRTYSNQYYQNMSNIDKILIDYFNEQEDSKYFVNR